METKNTTWRNIKNQPTKHSAAGAMIVDPFIHICSLKIMNQSFELFSLWWKLICIIGGFLEWCTLDKKLMQSYKSYQRSSWKGLASHKWKKSIHMQVKDKHLHNSKKRTPWRHKSKTQCWISYKSEFNLLETNFNLVPIEIEFFYTNFNFVQIKIEFCCPPPILIFDRCPVASFNAKLERKPIFLAEKVTKFCTERIRCSNLVSLSIYILCQVWCRGQNANCF